MRAAAAALGAVLLASLGWAQNNTGDVRFGDHNLSMTGTGPVTSDADEVCLLCHIPHTSRQDFSYLWNRQDGTQAFSPYQSTTFDAAGGLPGSISKLCLSCHDGTIALGQTLSSGTFSTSGELDPGSRIGSNLVTEHPFSMTPVDDGQIYPGLTAIPPVSQDPAVRLHQGRVECTSCHEPHVQDRDPVVTKFLVRSNSGGALCLACHDRTRPYPSVLAEWDLSSHTTSSSSVSVSSLPYSSVADNACQSCHAPHATAGVSDTRLLRAAEEAACLSCHDGSGTSPALPNLAAEFAKPFSHPTLSVGGLHDAAEDAFPLENNRHAECADCHNPHAASAAAGSPQAPLVTPPLRGVAGVDAASGRTALRPAGNEYEICFKCHAESGNKPQAVAGFSAFGRLPRRAAMGGDPYNKRLEFQSPASRHNVVLPRQLQNSDVPSLRSFMRTLQGGQGRSLGAGTQLYCSDCHGNNQAAFSGGTGPSGVHGSIYPHLLERRYEMNPLPASPGDNLAKINYQPGLNGTYALCDKCHDIQNSTLDDRSFDKHKKHIEGEGVSCAACHSPHGVAAGNGVNNSSLIAFDLDIVGPSQKAGIGPIFERTGQFRGRCYLTCHGEDHDPFHY